MQPSQINIPCVLSIAGSDSGGGAGVQADIKTFTAHAVYGASVITALTAQNTVGVQSVHIPPTEFVEEQLHSVLSDIRVDVVKTGMLPQGGIVRAVASAIREHHISKIVVDPVLVATSGDSLAGSDTMQALISDLLPLATVVTPNLSEAEKLTGRPIGGVSDMRQACIDIAAMGCSNVLLKGGHLINERGDKPKVYGDDCDPNVATDILYNGKDFQAFTKPRIISTNTHGTGCTLASSIAAQLAKKESVQSAVETAKEYVFKGIAQGLSIGRGHGPLNHMHCLRPFQR